MYTWGMDGACPRSSEPSWMGARPARIQRHVPARKMPINPLAHPRTPRRPCSPAVHPLAPARTRSTSACGAPRQASSSRGWGRGTTELGAGVGVRLRWWVPSFCASERQRAGQRGDRGGTEGDSGGRGARGRGESWGTPSGAKQTPTGTQARRPRESNTPTPAHAHSSAALQSRPSPHAGPQL